MHTRPRLLFPIFAAATVVAACTGQAGAPPPEQPSSTIPGAPASAAPAALQRRIEDLGRGFDGRVGIAVRDIQSGWTVDYNGAELLPQQSVAKLWVAITVLDAIDQGRMNLSDPVVVRLEDLSVFHQPIRAKVKAAGPAGWSTTVRALLEHALTESDNAANEVLVARAGGPAAIQDTLARKRIAGIAFGPGEKALQTGIAGLSWRADYSFGMAFWTAREALPDPVRRAAMEAYLANPPDGATPLALVDALARLKRGELLLPDTTNWLLSTLSLSKTGPRRLRAGLEPGWTLAHKTGTGQVLGALATGYNDVGVITAPDGRAYAVAVMIASTRRPVPARMELMSAVSRAVVAQHEGRDPADTSVPAAAP